MKKSTTRCDNEKPRRADSPETAGSVNQDNLGSVHGSFWRVGPSRVAPGRPFFVRHVEKHKV